MERFWLVHSRVQLGSVRFIVDDEGVFLVGPEGEKELRYEEYRTKREIAEFVQDRVLEGFRVC